MAPHDMTHNALSKDVLEELYIKNNKSFSEMAKTLSIGKSSVSRLLKKHGIPIKDLKTANSKKKKVTDECLLAAHKLYCSGSSLQTVATHYNVSPSRLCTLFRERSLSTRTQKEAMHAFQERRRPDVEPLYLDIINDKQSVHTAALRLNMSTSAYYRALHRLSLALPLPKGYSITEDDKL